MRLIWAKVRYILRMDGRRNRQEWWHGLAGVRRHIRVHSAYDAMMAVRLPHSISISRLIWFLQYSGMLFLKEARKFGSECFVWSIFFSLDKAIQFGLFECRFDDRSPLNNQEYYLREYWWWCHVGNWEALWWLRRRASGGPSAGFSLFISTRLPLFLNRQRSPKEGIL